MARTIFEPQHREALDQRLARLTPDSQRRWGKMSAPQMICHLKDSLDVALGLAPSVPFSRVMANPLVRSLVIYGMPWPRGKAPAAPEMLVTKPATWDADLALLRSLLMRAGERGAAADWPTHPTFGKLKGKDYGCLIYKHFNHHLTQFGV